MKIKITLYALSLAGGIFTAHCLGISQEKVIEKVVEVPVQVDNSDEVESLKAQLSQANALMNGEQKKIRDMLSEYGISGDERKISILVDTARWLAIAMYRECGVCNDTEAKMLGISLLEHLVDGKLGKTMEQVVKYRIPNGAYFLSFASNPNLFYLSQDAKDKYIRFALSVIANATDSSFARTTYDKMHEEAGLQVDAVYWCNEKASACSFHKQRTNQGCFKAVTADLRQDKTIAINPNQDIAKHTIYLQTNKAGCPK